GRGGMGVVYEAEQISLGRRVALKMLPFAATLDQRQLQRFHNEALAAAHLDHPNIVPIHWVGVERGVHFYAMRFVEGRSRAAAIDELRQAGGTAAGLPAPTASYSAQAARSDSSQSKETDFVLQISAAGESAAVTPVAETKLPAAISTQQSIQTRSFFH